MRVCGVEGCSTCWARASKGLHAGRGLDFQAFGTFGAYLEHNFFGGELLGAVFFGFGSAGDHPIKGAYGFLGQGVTNNVAEYSGLRAVLRHALARGHRRICIQMDSLLVVRQVRCEWACRSPEFRPQFSATRALLRQLAAQDVQILIEHIYREHNTHADSLANAALQSLTSRF